MTAAVALLLDQASKAGARSALHFGRKIEILPGLFSLRLAENPGGAFGALGSWPPLLILIGLAAILAIVSLRKEGSKSRLFAASLGLLLGGAMGNLIDRILFRRVTDFLDFGVTVSGRLVSWPTFNLADVAITIGVIVLAYHVLVRRDRSQESGARS